MLKVQKKSETQDLVLPLKQEKKQSKPRLASEAFQTLFAVADMIFSLVSEVKFAAIVDKSYGIDRAESNHLGQV